MNTLSIGKKGENLALKLLKKKGYRLNGSEIRNLCMAYRPGGSSVWNAVLSCLDDMGVDW